MPSRPWPVSPPEGDIVAALDIGSNSVKLLVVEVEPGGELRRRFDQMRISRLSEDLQATGRLSRRAMDRTIDAVEALLEAARVDVSEPLDAIVTAPGRRASNGAEFVRRLQLATGIEAEIADADTEAELSRLATRRSFPELDRFLMVDLGGASTELVLCRGDAADASTSIDQGAVRLSEAFLLARDPPSAADRRRAREAARASLAGISPELVVPDTPGVLVSGTATTLACIHLGLPRYDPDAVHRSILTADAIGELVDRLAAMTLAQKRKIPGIAPGRADVILGGAILVQAVIERTGLDRAWISDRGTRWGIAYRRIG